MTKRNPKDKKIQKNIALKRINKLFFMAEKKALFGDFDLADRYVELARKISMRNLVPIPKDFKRCFCKHCYCYLLPDVNCRIRIHRSRLIIYCDICKKYFRIPLKNSKK
jgi:ribonuclease P protein subunit RPR2